MEKETPKTYFLSAEILEMIWVGLHDSGQEDLARVVSDSMIAQGCQELVGVADIELILLFWKNYLEENNLATFNNPQEFH